MNLIHYEVAYDGSSLLIILNSRRKCFVLDDSPLQMTTVFQQTPKTRTVLNTLNI